DPIPVRIVPLNHIDEFLRHIEEPQQKQKPLTLTVVVDVDEKDTHMTVPINSHLKRMKSVCHDLMGAKRRKLITATPKEIILDYAVSFENNAPL
ncbi:hypothetical protein Dimus_037238, partial [Dionaea muscipula]